MEGLAGAVDVLTEVFKRTDAVCDEVRGCAATTLGRVQSDRFLATADSGFLDADEAAYRVALNEVDRDPRRRMACWPPLLVTMGRWRGCVTSPRSTSGGGGSG